MGIIIGRNNLTYHLTDRNSKHLAEENQIIQRLKGPLILILLERKRFRLLRKKDILELIFIMAENPKW